MEFLPRLLVLGGFVVPQELAVGGKVPRAKFTRIYGELADAGYEYGTFNLLPDNSGAQMQSRRPDDMVLISPPLIQTSMPLAETTIDGAGTKAQTIFKIAANALAVPAVQNLGVRIVYDVPLHTNDAKEFILNRVLSHGGEHQEELALGGEMWGGIKYVVVSPNGEAQHTIQIEPSVADNMRSLYVDVDTQFPGGYPVDAVATKVSTARSYVDEHICRYLEKMTETN